MWRIWGSKRRDGRILERAPARITSRVFIKRYIQPWMFLVGSSWKRLFYQQCHGGKKSKHRFTVALIVNADGEKEVPIVIWKSEKPRCFKGINVSSLPVHYYSQSKAWMTGEILDKVLMKLNRKFSFQHRNVALLLDNAGCHLEELKGKYSNIKLIFFAAKHYIKITATGCEDHPKF